MIKKSVYTIMAVLCAACTSMLPEKIDIVSVGIVPDSIEISASSGEDGVAVIADRDYKAEVLSGSEWLSLGLTGADTLSFSFSANENFRRSAIIRISADGREDQLLVKQEGLFKETLSLSQTEVEAPVEGCEVSVRVLSNLPTDYFEVSVSNSLAIDNVHLKSNTLTFNVLPTTNRDKRSYAVTVSYTDGWGDVLSAGITVLQEAYD